MLNHAIYQRDAFPVKGRCLLLVTHLVLDFSFDREITRDQVEFVLNVSVGLDRCVYRVKRSRQIVRTFIGLCKYPTCVSDPTVVLDAL